MAIVVDSVLVGIHNWASDKKPGRRGEPIPIHITGFTQFLGVTGIGGRDNRFTLSFLRSDGNEHEGLPATRVQERSFEIIVYACGEPISNAGSSTYLGPVEVEEQRGPQLYYVFVRAVSVAVATEGTEKIETPESGNIDYVSYTASASMLELKFKSGQRWQYDQVPRETWDEMQKADSKGKFFATKIKGIYTGVRVP